MTMNYQLGFDIGSISVNSVVLDPQGNVTEEHYDYCHGRPFHVLHDRMTEIFKKYAVPNLELIAFTGMGGKKAAEILGGIHINEIIAQAAAVGRIHPEVRTVIEMGGEDSKLIFMANGEVSEQSRLSDFSMNSLCAAGTGSFLDQQAKRIGVSIEKEFGEMALKSVRPPRIAGRCSVFAKSDMIHLQQIATPVEDIIAGLCYAVARNLRTTLGRGKHFVPPVSFHGGVAANAGMVRAFKDVLKLDDKAFIIPKHFAAMGAIGAVYQAQKNLADIKPFTGLSNLEAYLKVYEKSAGQSLEVLKPTISAFDKTIVAIPEESKPIEVALGLDVGSLSTNLVLINSNNEVIARRYLPTASQPIEAIRRGLKEIYDEVGERVNVIAAGTTGSGRYLTGDFIGADSIQNEITAQATATIYFDPEVDTIFEIGGQDSKYIHVDQGVIVDFEMNKVCAAGTGSFLEEQAERLDINIIKEFEKLAFEAKAPSRLGDRCTVFMESDLNSFQQKGEEKENLVAGLAYSTVQNYLNRVVAAKPVGNRVYYQGGVTNNRAVVAAFEKVTGKKIHIPPHFDITGAIGAAMLARERIKPGEKSRFKGFDISHIPYKLDKFICKYCSNHCEIREVMIEGEKPFYYGGICDRYDVEERKGSGLDIPNLFEERTSMLLEGFDTRLDPAKRTIGIPRELTLFYQQFPYWRTFLEELGFNVVLSGESNNRLLTRSIEMMTCETCLPIEMVHGHVDDLMRQGVDFVFLPFIVNMPGEENNPTNNCNCPWIQSHPFMVRAAYSDTAEQHKLLIPTLHMRYYDTAFKDEISTFAKETFGIGKRKVMEALKKAEMAQEQFESKLKSRGREVLAGLEAGQKAFVVLGRSYNTGDPALNLNLVEKLRNMNILAIPLDYLPLEQENVFDYYPMMYWPGGQKILAGARIIAKDDRLNAVHLGNFRCGPDSFIRHYLRREMKGKPYLHLEVDEHSANAGMITRIEAFIDSLQGWGSINSTRKTETEKKKSGGLPITERTLYFPYANDVVWAFVGACRSLGMKADLLPMQNEKDLEIARKHTNGQECFPLICTTGSFVKKLMEPGVDPAKVAFFMPDHNGPCRFGGYNKLQEIIFNNLGYGDAMIIHPSNEDNYTSIAPGNPVKWRLVAWRGLVAIDMIRKLLQQIRPYERHKGEADQVYQSALQAVVKSLEGGGKTLVRVVKEEAINFKAIECDRSRRKPIIAVVGEIFMRDNAFCSGNVVRRLEELGAETMMAPFSEWISYSTYRYTRDSRWKKNTSGLLRSKIQGKLQHYLEDQIVKAVNEISPTGPMVRVEEMLQHCDQYIHHDYDGDPPLSLGTTAILSKDYISGVVNILPFTCMPGTLNTSVSEVFRRENRNLPWENFAYDGQDDASIENRMQAFMHQAKEYAALHKLDELPVLA
ncbi:MAG: acyl-CoA dehydratase activase [Bacteroidales bacterium]|nr:acyl-CoA dehydratase activase [Bacteroidales bacterium]